MGRNLYQRPRQSFTRALAGRLQPLGGRVRDKQESARDRSSLPAYVDMKNRLTCHCDGDTIVLLAHCNHDILKRPYGPSR